MTELGILVEGECVELVEGQLVVMPPVGSDDAPAVQALHRCLVQVVGDRGVVAAASPVQLDDLCVAKPDLTVLGSKKDDHPGQIIRSHEVLLVVEVAGDDSLAYDLLVKRCLYSRRGIPELWIVNLAEGLVEVCRAPDGDDYASVFLVGDEGVLEPELLAGAAFPAATIFRPPIAGTSR
jgi:Uma2 family endonuclease